jgi:hypothetical protein
MCRWIKSWSLREGVSATGYAMGKVNTRPWPPPSLPALITLLRLQLNSEAERKEVTSSWQKRYAKN